MTTQEKKQVTIAPVQKENLIRQTIDPLRKGLKKGVTTDKLIQQTVDPLNQKMKERYQKIIPGAELNGTINKIQSDKLIEYYDKHGNFDGALTPQNLPKMQSQQLGMTSYNENSWANIWGDYSYVIGVLVLGIGLLCFKSADGHLKLNKFLLGDDGLYRKLLKKVGKGKEKVSESNLFLHNKALKEVQKFASAVSRIDNEKFGQQEFLLFAKVQFCLSNKVGEYADLKENLALLQASLQAQSSYITIHQIELSSQGSKQQEFYNYTYTQLQEDPEAEYLTVNLQKKLAEILPQIKTEQGKTTLQAYTKAISELSESSFALKLLIKFKELHLDDFSNLRNISELINNLKGQEVENLNTLIYLVMANYDDFEAIAEIIGITEKQSSPDTFARLIQYIALKQRHQASFSEFQRFIQVLRQWHKPYITLLKLRKEHPPEEYWQPKDFAKQISGYYFYQKYKDSLTDQKTGYNYIDFEEEIDNSTT